MLIDLSFDELSYLIAIQAYLGYSLLYDKQMQEHLISKLLNLYSANLDARSEKPDSTPQ